MQNQAGPNATSQELTTAFNLEQESVGRTTPCIKYENTASHGPQEKPEDGEALAQVTGSQHFGRVGSTSVTGRRHAQPAVPRHMTTSPTMTIF